MFIRPLKLTQHVDVQGNENAPVLVLLHSLGTDFHLWDLQMPRLTERYRVIRLDIRGHGLSAVDALEFSMSDLADDVIAALDYLHINTQPPLIFQPGTVTWPALSAAFSNLPFERGTVGRARSRHPPVLYHDGESPMSGSKLYRFGKSDSGNGADRSAPEWVT